MVIFIYNLWRQDAYSETQVRRRIDYGSDPAAPHEELRLAPNSTVGLMIERGKIVIRPQPRKGRVGLKARLAMCDFSKPMSKEERAWTTGPRAGREEI